MSRAKAPSLRRLSLPSFAVPSTAKGCLKQFAIEGLLLILLQLKCPRDVEAKVDVALEEIASRLSKKCSFSEPLRIGHHKLKHVTTRFNVNAKADRIIVGIGIGDIKPVIIFSC